MMIGLNGRDMESWNHQPCMIGQFGTTRDVCERHYIFSFNSLNGPSTAESMVL